MVEEVVPFSEHFAAVFVLALEQSYDPSGVGAPVLKDHVIFGVWNVFLDSDLFEVELLTVPNDDELFLLDQLILLEVFFEVKIELGFDFLHCVKRILDSHDLLRFLAALFVRRMFMMLVVV